MRKAAIAGLFACTVIFAASSSSVSAKPLDLLSEKKPQNSNILALIEAPARVENKKPVEVKPESKIYEIEKGETLNAVAEQNQTTWKRLFDKNENIIHPDIIKPGDKVIIPLPDEILKDRPLPEPPVVQPTLITSRQPTSRNTQANRVATTSPAAGSTSGNKYSPGYCTWFAKNMRPDLPNNLGNADTWVSRAAAQGLATGSTPTVGAIGQQGMHVVYVQSVNGDGTVTITEMNYRGLYVITTRTVPAGTFRYIN